MLYTQFYETKTKTEAMHLLDFQPYDFDHSYCLTFALCEGPDRA